MERLRGLYDLNDTKRLLCNCWCTVLILTCKWTFPGFPFTIEQARNQLNRWWIFLLSSGACTAASNHQGIAECVFWWEIALEIQRSCLIFRQCSILRCVVSLFYFFRTSRLQSVGWVVDTEHQELYKNTVRWVAESF